MIKQYKTLRELYLTFLTRQDSYMKKIPEGTILTLENGDLCFEGVPSIDDHVGYLYHKFIEEVQPNW